MDENYDMTAMPDALKKQQETIAKMKSMLTEYEQLLETKNVSGEYKDRLFKFIFGNPENREWTLDLYNAVNGTDYKDPSAILFNTIGQFLYLKMRNDASFIIYFEMNMWEHQSSYNPNMPMRFLRYGTRLYEKFIATTDYYEFGSTLQRIPRPVCVCFYNGTAEQPEKKVLKLSDAYEGDGDIEVKVTMLNINYGKNKCIMDSCKPLEEYAWFVNEIRANQRNKMELEQAVDTAVSKMPENFVIRKFIIANRAEVKNMLFTEYNEELVRKYDRIEAHKEGYDEGHAEGFDKGHAEGFDEGHAELNELYSYLHRNKRDADIFKAFTDKDFRDYLLEEYRKLNSKTE